MQVLQFVGATDAALKVTVGGEARSRYSWGEGYSCSGPPFPPLPKVSRWTWVPTRPLKVHRNVPSQRVPGWGLVQAGGSRPLTHTHTQSTSARDKGYNGAGRAGGGW